MSSPTVSTVHPGSVGTSIARFVLPHADGNAPVTYFTSPLGLVNFRMSMCSASQPSSRARTEAMRNARVSGKCTMYFVSASVGHGTSASPAASGAPTL